MTDETKKRWKLPEEPPRWLKWIPVIGATAVVLLKFIKELLKP